jgi:hypothetical protein
MVVRLIVNLEFCAIRFEGAHERDHLVGKFPGRGVSACVHAIIEQTGDDLNMRILPLDALKHLWLGLTHHLYDFYIGLTDDPVVSVVKDLLISAVHADTAGSGGHYLPPLAAVIHRPPAG